MANYPHLNMDYDGNVGNGIMLNIYLIPDGNGMFSIKLSTDLPLRAVGRVSVPTFPPDVLAAIEVLEAVKCPLKTLYDGLDDLAGYIGGLVGGDVSLEPRSLFYLDTEYLAVAIRNLHYKGSKWSPQANAVLSSPHMLLTEIITYMFKRERAYRDENMVVDMVAANVSEGEEVRAWLIDLELVHPYDNDYLIAADTACLNTVMLWIQNSN